MSVQEKDEYTHSAGGHEVTVGIFDSGIGGLGVLHEAVCALPQARFLFYADRAHVPYGERSEREILSYAEEITAFLRERGCAAIVIACNTATSVAAEALREHYRGEGLPIIGMEPAVKPALEWEPEGPVLVIATPVTVREHKLQALLERLDATHRVHVHPMPELVRFAEGERFEDPAVEAYLAEELMPYVEAGIQSVVLGCTHFNYFVPQLRALFGPGVRLFDGNDGTVRHLAALLGLQAESEPDGRFRESAFDQTRITCFDSGVEITDPAELAFFSRLHARFAQTRQ
ncbi:MAG: glutamate racemase [Butyrivibrio sp.]|nr:glutamate racemase [Butyrivibrio sp.]